MKKATVFYMIGCPYCESAKRAVQALKQEDERIAALDIEWIDENRQNALASQYDYDYVPSIFSGKKKLYEAQPGQKDAEIKESVRKALLLAYADDEPAV